MKLEWDYTALSYFDQLPGDQQARVLAVVEVLPGSWDRLDASQMHKVQGPETDLYTLRAGNDLLVLVQRQNELIRVVDIVPRRQIEGLRRAMLQSQAAPG